MMEVKKAL